MAKGADENLMCPIFRYEKNMNIYWKKRKKVIRLRRQILVILDMQPCKEVKSRNSLDLV